jgi:hypothetical protein
VDIKKNSSAKKHNSTVIFFDNRIDEGMVLPCHAELGEAKKMNTQWQKLQQR